MNSLLDALRDFHSLHLRLFSVRIHLKLHHFFRRQVHASAPLFYTQNNLRTNERRFLFCFGEVSFSQSIELVLMTSQNRTSSALTNADLTVFVRLLQHQVSVCDPIKCPMLSYLGERTLNLMLISGFAKRIYLHSSTDKVFAIFRKFSSLFSCFSATKITFNNHTTNNRFLCLD